MPELIERYLPYLLIVLCFGGWFGVTTLIGVHSGWHSLMRRYPDRIETPLLTLRFQSGSMGRWVRFRSILWLSACPSGLRIGIPRIFGVYCKDFLVPWAEISVTRRQLFFSSVAELHFGTPTNGRLVLSAQTVNRLARAARGSWPEALQGESPATNKNATRP